MIHISNPDIFIIINFTALLHGTLVVTWNTTCEVKLYSKSQHVTVDLSKSLFFNEYGHHRHHHLPIIHFRVNIFPSTYFNFVGPPYPALIKQINKHFKSLLEQLFSAHPVHT